MSRGFHALATLLPLLLLPECGWRHEPAYTVPLTVQHAADVTSPMTRFFAVGDTGTGAPEEYRVAEAIARTCRQAGCDFGLLLGDNFYPSGVRSSADPQWRTKLEAPYASILSAGVPLYPVLGNHDYDDRRWELALPQIDYGRIHTFWRMADRSYRFDSRHAAFAALDTTAVAAGVESAVRYESRVMTDAAKRSRPWLVAFGHHTYRSNGTNGAARPSWARFFKENICPAADLYLSGHDHNLQVLDAAPDCQPLRVVAGGGGFDTHRLVGANPALFQRESHGFAYVTIEADRLRVEMLDDSGTTLFAHEIRR